MPSILVFDPAMCCSTGICGPSVDPQLARFAADLDWLKSQGITVERFNLSQQPAAFAGDPEVKNALEAKGEAALPLIKVDGIVTSVGAFPSRDELARWAGVATSRAAAAVQESPSLREASLREASLREASGCCARPADDNDDASAKRNSGCC